MDNVMTRWIQFRALFALALTLVSASVLATPYAWNYPAPLKTPATSTSNGKLVMFDVSHGGTEGNADWVINGGFSSFADALVAEGYTVQEYRGVDKNGDGVIQFVDDYTTPGSTATTANEAVITSAGINAAEVLVLAESNRPFTLAEQSALANFVASGKGLFFIADHYNADRNLNAWDSTEVFNGYNRATLSQFNIGGAYGDLRNPGQAGSGWLAQTFGVRFRFNAIDWLSGVSGIASSGQSEGVTQGVSPILMAGGSTLAITDPSRAKGLVYFSGGDSPARWSHAVDSGVYFGGRDEGPYVAISKSGAGKAAFIGDSSPIEDDSPLYLRQDSGSAKTTYPGWTDSGNAAVLAVNLINWLAQPESYSHFDGSAHPAGEVTPDPFASEEQSDPDAGQPWSTPSGGYNPWDAATFADGAYGAPNSAGGVGSTPGSGAVSVSVALAQTNGTAVIVTGTITQAINGEFALEMAEPQDPSATLYVKLESQYRDAFSPQYDPSLIGKTLQVSGTRDDYMAEPSVESVTDMQLVSSGGGNSAGCGSGDAVSVSTAYASAIGTPLTVIGTVVQGINDPYALELADLDGSTSIYVKLESDQRGYYSPANNPGVVAQVLEVDGQRDSYMSTPSMESVTRLTLPSGCP